MNIWKLFGIKDEHYTEASGVDKAEAKLDKAGTFGQVEGSLTGEQAAPVGNKTAGEMVQEELGLMKGLGM